MVVRDFHVVSVPLAPPEANAPLIVDTDTVLTVTHTAQCLEVVCRRSAKSVESPRGMYGHKLAHRCSLYAGRQLQGAYALEKLLRLFAIKGPYHSKDNIAIG